MQTFINKNVSIYQNLTLEIRKQISKHIKIQIMFEKVNPFHPDKVADRIGGAIVDLCYTITEVSKVDGEQE